MTRQIDDDLRGLLAARAEEVAPDVSQGEVAVADSLARDDRSTSPIDMTRASLRRRWPIVVVAAAVVAVVVGGTGRLLLEDEPDRVESNVTGPSAAPPAMLRLSIGAPVVRDFCTEPPATGPGSTVLVEEADGSERCLALGPSLDGTAALDGADVVPDPAGTTWRVELQLTDVGLASLVERATCPENASCVTPELAIVVDDEVVAHRPLGVGGPAPDDLWIGGLSEGDARALAASLLAATTLPPAPVLAELAPVLAWELCLRESSPGFTESHGGTCYELGPKLGGDGNVSGATAVPASDGSWRIRLDLTDGGSVAVAHLNESCLARDPACPTNLLATVIDGTVLSASNVWAAPAGVDEVIVGEDLTEHEARTLAAQISAATER